MRNKKKSKRRERYIPLSDIEKIDDKYLTEMENVKRRLNNVKDEAIINAVFNVLLSSYNAVIEIQTLEREVDYDIKCAKIEARRKELKPWRRCWLWRLIGRPLTNRAQDIIEERAAVEADIIHTEEERAIDEERKKLPQDEEKRLSARKIKSRMRDKLKAVIETADNADTSEAFTEPENVPLAQDNANVAEQTEEQPQQQMCLDELTPVQTRRPRPPRNCRKRTT